MRQPSLHSQACDGHPSIQHALEILPGHDRIPMPAGLWSLVEGCSVANLIPSRMRRPSERTMSNCDQVSAKQIEADTSMCLWRRLVQGRLCVKVQAGHPLPLPMGWKSERQLALSGIARADCRNHRLCRSSAPMSREAQKPPPASVAGNVAHGAETGRLSEGQRHGAVNRRGRPERCGLA